MSKIIDSAESVNKHSISEFPERPSHPTVILVDPEFFDREYKINPYMHGSVDKQKAEKQWQQLRTVYEQLADDIRVVSPAETYQSLRQNSSVPQPTDRPDMVFVANHALPTPDGEELVLARMGTEERSQEPEYFKFWAREQGYTVHGPPSAIFEGMGDAIWHPERELLWGGYGVRSERAAYDEIADILDVAVIPIELTDERYYHLDVCMAPLSPSTVLIQPEAFTHDGRKKIEAMFDQVLTAPSSEATDALSVNVEIIDGTVIIGSDSPETTTVLENAGFDVQSVDTSEFMKAGGSVCCLSLFAGTPG